jgi:hypothetical protein
MLLVAMTKLVRLVERVEGERVEGERVEVERVMRMTTEVVQRHHMCILVTMITMITMVIVITAMLMITTLVAEAEEVVEAVEVEVEVGGVALVVSEEEEG